MNQQCTQRAVVTLALTVCLCCIAAGCGQAPGDEYRTYAETIADAPLPLEPVVASNATILPAVVDSLPVSQQAEFVASDASPLDAQSEPNTDAEDLDELAVVVPVQIELSDIRSLEPELEDVPAIIPREIELLVPENEFHTVGPEGAVRVSYDDIDLLKVLNMDPVPATAVSYFPGWLRGLDGQRVRIRGFMFPPVIETGIPAFVLARDNQICCFGKNPMPYDIVPVVLQEDVTTDYIFGRPFDVVGVFQFNVEMNPDDPTKVKRVYFIDDAIIIDQ